MGLGRPLGAKLFLEGIEVPFIGATITCTVGQASIAYVDLVPHKEIMNIKPRTRVEIFVRNYQDEGPDCVFPYVIAWSGEVFGLSFGRTPASRTFSISCIDMTGYWDNVIAYYFNPQQSAGAGGMNMSAQAMEMTDLNKMGFRVITTTIAESSYFKNKVEEVLKDSQKDFLDAVIAIYEDIGFINDYFRTANYRSRISDQIVLKSSQALKKLLEGDEAYRWFTGMIGQLSGLTTLRQAISDLLGMIFHDSVTMPFPAAVKREADFSKENVNGSPRKNGLSGKSAQKKTLGTFAFKPNLFMMPPPVCNIFFPDEYSGFQFSRNFFKEPTRLIYLPELPARFGQGTEVFLPHVYEPPSFSYYMNKSKGSYDDFKGKESTSVPNSTSAHYGDDDKNPDTTPTNLGKMRMWNFLTNEEHIKGVWLARESMVPATSQFRQNLDQFGEEKKLNFSQRIAEYLFYKKRFQDRNLQITSHLKLSVVPGFPVLVLDDSDADQTVVAYCNSVTHRIYATEGGYTNVQLSYARYVAEQDSSTHTGQIPLIPPWFSETIFGTVGTCDSKAATDEVRSAGITHVASPKLSEFYESLLGSKGSKCLSNYYDEEKSLLGASRRLAQEYKAMKEKGTRDLQHFIAAMTSRDYVRMKRYYEFFEASTEVNDSEIDNADWLEFKGDLFTRKGKPDAGPISERRSIIEVYRDTLKTWRGFSG